MLDPACLKTFATVANCRGFTGVGRQLGLNQSSVGEHIHSCTSCMRCARIPHAHRASSR
ncbi:hypothetical protein BSLA_02f1613 [Burkholderia stabilis]|nr:hypothetical protein BSLA_02f1613 [Burkholderia stabilis]